MTLSQTCNIEVKGPDCTMYPLLWLMLVGAEHYQHHVALRAIKSAAFSIMPYKITKLHCWKLIFSHIFFSEEKVALKRGEDLEISKRIQDPSCINMTNRLGKTHEENRTSVLPHSLVIAKQLKSLEVDFWGGRVLILLLHIQWQVFSSCYLPLLPREKHSEPK